ncbi:MAG: hypothetical protein FWC39_14260 [Bacteroidetes bacterium]|nr:hypothetical protein [Bacteroidota bacterium]
MGENYDLRELLKNPHTPLTKEQYENWDKYLKFTNDDKTAADVDISTGIAERIKEIESSGTYWR